MAHKHIVVCDGCDKEELVVADVAPTIDSVTVSIKAAPDTAFDLCPACHQRMIAVTDPHKWPRAVTAN